MTSGARRRRRRILVFAAACLLGLQSAAADAPPHPAFPVAPSRAPDETARPPPPCQICETAERQRAAGCARPAGQPYADLIYLRRPGVASDLPPGVLDALARSRAGQDMVQADRLLLPLTTGADPAIRYAALANLLMLRAQSGGRLDDSEADRLFESLDVAAALLEHSSGDGQGGMTTSDADFLHALKRLAAGEETAALDRLDRALVKEPGYFNALALALRLNIARAGRRARRSRALCQDAFDRLLGAAAALVDLEPCPTQAAHTAIYLARTLARPESNPAYLAVETYLAVVAKAPAAAEQALRRFFAAEAPACGRRVGRDLKALAERAAAPQ